MGDYSNAISVWSGREREFCKVNGIGVFGFSFAVAIFQAVKKFCFDSEFVSFYYLLLGNAQAEREIFLVSDGEDISTAKWIKLL